MGVKEAIEKVLTDYMKGKTFNYNQEVTCKNPGKIRDELVAEIRYQVSREYYNKVDESFFDIEQFINFI